MIKEALSKLENKEGLTSGEMEGIFTEIMDGKAETEDIARFLTALKNKGETVDEITGAARVMRKFAVKINHQRPDIVDTCGTGGDESGTFNISTVSAFAASGAGCAVAKHGNKAVSSKCGSADMLEEIGVNINADKALVEKCIRSIGIGFLFAPKMHLAMKYAMPARQMIRMRSIFNILGPLTNPAAAKRQVLGVFAKGLVEPLARVLKNLGSVHAMVVHGNDGLDEITTTDFTYAAELKDGRIQTYTINPGDYGIGLAKKEDLAGGSPVLNAKIALDVLRGVKGPKRDIVVLNAAAAIYVGGAAEDLKTGIGKAEESIDSGAALDKLEQLKLLTNEI